MLLSDLVSRLLRPALTDPDAIAFENVEVLAAANEGIQATCLVRSDANVTFQPFQLAAGTRQAVPAGFNRVVKITHNLGPDGATPGRAVRYGDMAVFDAERPDWRTESAAAVVRNWFYDPATPRAWWNYPAAAAGAWVELALSGPPAEMTDSDTLGDTIPLGDEFAPAIAEWVLYRLYNRDQEGSPNIARAGNHYRSFFNLLQVDLVADLRAQIQQGRPAQ